VKGADVGSGSCRVAEMLDIISRIFAKVLIERHLFHDDYVPGL
jgi:hypothetical protein